jgi:hypothetical protein
LYLIILKKPIITNQNYGLFFLLIKISDGEWRLGIGLQKKLFTLHFFAQIGKTVTKINNNYSVLFGGWDTIFFSKKLVKGFP